MINGHSLDIVFRVPLTTLLDIINKHNLGHVADDEDEDDAGEESGHGRVPPVRAARPVRAAGSQSEPRIVSANHSSPAGGHGARHQRDVVLARTGDRAVDQPVEHAQDQHRQQPHHWPWQAHKVNLNLHFCHSIKQHFLDLKH